MKKKLTALGAYIFAGGFTVGVRRHFQVVGHFEDGPFGVATAERNIPELRGRVFQDPDHWPIKEFAGKVNYLYANPPCAPWSAAGNRHNRVPWQLNPQTECWRRTAQLIWDLRPDVAHVESVRPLYRDGKEMLREFAAAGRKRGYQFLALLEDAKDVGVAQRRPRFVMCLTRHEYVPSWPDHELVLPGEVLAEHRRAIRDGAVPKTNLRRAAADLSKTIEGKLLKHTPPGGRLSKQFDKMFPRAKPNAQGILKGRPSMLKYRVDPKKLSNAQPGGAILFHPKQDRYLTIGEAAVLCSYPHEFEFMGSISSAYAQMGKAVLPLVGQHLAKDAKATILAAKPANVKEMYELTFMPNHVHYRTINLED